MASSILGTELKTLGEGIIHGIGLSLSQKEKLLMWPLSRRIEIDVGLVLNLFSKNELLRDP